MKRLIFVLAIALMLPACAANSLAVKQQAVNGLSAGETALHEARVSELTLYTSHAVPTYTTTQHLAFLDGLEAAQRAEISTARALQLWTPGQSAPADAAGYVAAAQSIVSIIQALNVPQARDALSKAQAVLDNANTVVKMLGGKR